MTIITPSIFVVGAVIAGGATPVENWLLRLGALCMALTAVLFFLLPAFRRLRDTNQRVEEFLDDWNGEPARPGVTARPGVMPRLATIEEGMEAAREESRRLSQRLSHLEDTVKAMG